MKTGKRMKTISQLQAQLSHLNRSLDAVHKISQALFSKTKLDDLVKETLRVSMETVNADAGSVILYDPTKNKLVFKYVVGEKEKELTGFQMDPNQGIAGEVFQSGEAKISEDVAKEKVHFREVGERIGYITKNMVTVPLKTTQGNPVGVMQILNKKEGLFNKQDLEVLGILGGQAAVAIENARLAEEAKLAEVVKLMGDISHDIKNMITPVMTCAQTLEILFKSFFEDLEELTSQYRDLQPEMVEQLQQAARFLRDFYPEAIEMFYDGSTAVQERVREIADCVKGIISEPHFEFANINEIIKKVVKALKLVAERNGIEIIQEFGDLLPSLVDQRRIYNAVYNLVNNAIPETPKGGKITIKTEAQTEGEFPEGSYIMIQVSDTGRGMPEHIRAKLFTEDVISTKPGGTGLGTRIVKNAVDIHQGKVWVESQEGRGTSFYIKIPYK